jgi:hypothetical protein
MIFSLTGFRNYFQPVHFLCTFLVPRRSSRVCGPLSGTASAWTGLVEGRAFSSSWATSISLGKALARGGWACVDEERAIQRRSTLKSRGRGRGREGECLKAPDQSNATQSPEPDSTPLPLFPAHGCPSLANLLIVMVRSGIGIGWTAVVPPCSSSAR